MERERARENTLNEIVTNLLDEGGFDADLEDVEAEFGGVDTNVVCVCVKTDNDEDFVWVYI